MTYNAQHSACRLASAGDPMRAAIYRTRGSYSPTARTQRQIMRTLIRPVACRACRLVEVANMWYAARGVFQLGEASRWRDPYQAHLQKERT